MLHKHPYLSTSLNNKWRQSHRLLKYLNMWPKTDIVHLKVTRNLYRTIPDVFIILQKELNHG